MARIGAFIIFFVISVSLASFSIAREFPRLPSVIDGVIFSGGIPVVSKTTTVVGCDGGQDHHFSAEYLSFITGKYGSLVLNALPKGSVPASGPSKRINDVKT
ncbi:hypothetical protein CARUB_v10003272mg [Capsella rubella]|uniref:Uncharacterized protein n=1 Tax=Capsella rubella TaxID=81985 RepID=R0HC52_9BRAS|nr:uncharacterized protein LOC17882679 [Capsella rubella]EOA22605.1 hypothetical protein CARUB_v10003272mg [Capsella rubella]